MVLHTNRSPETSRVWYQREFHCSMVASKHRDQEQEISARVPSLESSTPFSAWNTFLKNADVAHHIIRINKGRIHMLFPSGPKCSGCFSLYLRTYLGCKWFATQAMFLSSKGLGMSTTQKGLCKPQGSGPKKSDANGKPPPHPLGPSNCIELFAAC